MSNIINYIKKYGNKTFEEKAFNEVDNTILSILSYINFDGIVAKSRVDKICLEDAINAFFTKYSKKEVAYNLFCIQATIKVIGTLKNAPRFKDLKVYNYIYKCNNDKQFSALFIDLDNKTTFISFEGTNELVSGWKEDFELCYKFPVAAQREAIKYLNRSISIFTGRQYILGGHSKGGNLALVAGMYANPLIRNKIIKIYNNDGPGLKTEVMNSIYYKKVKNIYELIVPNYSLVGLLLRHPDDYHVILSNKIGLMAHNVLSWQVMNDHFVNAKLSSYSKKLDDIITGWLDKYNDVEREKFVKDLFAIFYRAKIDNLLDLKGVGITNILTIIKESKQLDKESKKMIQEFIKFMVEYLKRDTLAIIQNKTLQ